LVKCIEDAMRRCDLWMPETNPWSAWPISNLLAFRFWVVLQATIRNRSLFRLLTYEESFGMHIIIQSSNLLQYPLLPHLFAYGGHSKIVNSCFNDPTTRTILNYLKNIVCSSFINSSSLWNPCRHRRKKKCSKLIVNRDLTCIN